MWEAKIRIVHLPLYISVAYSLSERSPRIQFIKLLLRMSYISQTKLSWDLWRKRSSFVVGQCFCSQLVGRLVGRLTSKSMIPILSEKLSDRSVCMKEGPWFSLGGKLSGKVSQTTSVWVGSSWSSLKGEVVDKWFIDGDKKKPVKWGKHRATGEARQRCGFSWSLVSVWLQGAIWWGCELHQRCPYLSQGGWLLYSVSVSHWL